MKRGRTAPKSNRPTKRGRTIAPVRGYQSGRALAKKPGMELKAFDHAQTVTGFSSAAPNVAYFNFLVSGSELYQRVGRKVYMKSLHLRGWVQNSATSVADFARIIVFYDANPNGQAITQTDLLQDSNAAAAVSATAEINLFNRERFQILRDHQILLPSVTNTGGVLTNSFIPQTDSQMNIDMFIKLKGLEAVYNGTNGGTIADIQTGAIGMLLMCETSTNEWDFTWHTRLRYYD